MSTDIIRYTSQPLSLGSSATWKIDFGAHNSTLRNRCQRHLKMDDQELKMTEMNSYPPQSSLWVLNQHDLWYLNNSQHDCDSRLHTGYKIIHIKTDQTMEHWKSKNMGHLMTFNDIYIVLHLESRIPPCDLIQFAQNGSVKFQGKWSGHTENAVFQKYTKATSGPSPPGPICNSKSFNKFHLLH